MLEVVDIFDGDSDLTRSKKILELHLNERFRECSNQFPFGVSYTAKVEVFYLLSETL